MKTPAPYLDDPNRLTDVLAAIQAMGTYKYYKLTFAGWSDRICGSEERAAHWQKVFEQHPEFFRLDSQREKASLVWRRQYSKRYHVDLDQTLPKAEVDRLSPTEKLRVSRNPLSASDIQALISTATELHSRALAQRQDRRWWLPLTTGVAALIGSVVGSFLRNSGT